MATLEKIRSKSVFLIVVIGVALLAFIVGDALTNSRNLFGDHTTVAKIGSDKIDYTDYQRKREELNNRLEQARAQNPEQFANFDVQILPQMAIDELIGEKLLDEAADKAGIRTSSSQLRHYIMDMGASQRLQEIMQQLNAAGFSANTPQQAYSIIFEPKKNNMTEAQAEPYQRAWIAMEEETKQNVKRQTYQRLVYGTVKANDLDRRALYNNQVSTANVEVAFLPFGALDEKKYPVADNELRDAYNAEKNLFKVDEQTKDVSFIAVSITPSEADVQAARSLAKDVVKELRDSAATLSKGLKKEGISIERHTLRASDIASPAVKEYVARAPKDSVSVVSENISGFTIVKMGKRTLESDSLYINLVQVAGAGLPSKVLASLNSGLSLDSVPARFSADSVMVQANQGFPVFTAQGRSTGLQQSQIDSLVMAGGRYISILDTPQGSVLASLVKKSAPVEVYEYEQVNYALAPGSKTVGDERAKLEKFLLNNKTAKDFNANAAKAGYNVQHFNLTQSSAAVPRMQGMQQYYPDSRQVVRWVMIDGKEGEVSHIYESKNALNPVLYAVAVDEVYDDYAPLSNADVKQYFTDKVRRQKAGADLEKQYKGKATSVKSAAAAMGVEPRVYDSFRFGNNSGVYDSAVMGRINGTKADKKAVVVKGQDGLYVFQVNGNKTENFPYNEQAYDQQYFQLVNPQFDQMLRGSKKFKNNAYKFEAGE